MITRRKMIATSAAITAGSILFKGLGCTMADKQANKDRKSRPRLDFLVTLQYLNGNPVIPNLSQEITSNNDGTPPSYSMDGGNPGDFDICDCWPAVDNNGKTWWFAALDYEGDKELSCDGTWEFQSHEAGVDLEGNYDQLGQDNGGNTALVIGDGSNWKSPKKRTPPVYPKFAQTVILSLSSLLDPTNIYPNLPELQLSFDNTKNFPEYSSKPNNLFSACRCFLFPQRKGPPSWLLDITLGMQLPAQNGFPPIKNGTRFLLKRKTPNYQAAGNYYCINGFGMARIR